MLGESIQRISLHTRPINPTTDRAYVLERHCRTNYACDSPWARAIPYERYRANWFAMPGQMDGFWQHLTGSMNDPRTIAELLLDEDDAIIGYLWAPFWEEPEAGFSCLELQDLYIEERARRQGHAARWLAYAEQKAREHGAKVLRSGTGCENVASQALHKNAGFYVQRYEYEKEL